MVNCANTIPTTTTATTSCSAFHPRAAVVFDFDSRFSPLFLLLVTPPVFFASAFHFALLEYLFSESGDVVWPQPFLERIKRSSSLVTRFLSFHFFLFLFLFLLSLCTIHSTRCHSLSSPLPLHSYDFDCYPVHTNTTTPLHSPLRKFPHSLSLSLTYILREQSSEPQITATIHNHNNHHSLLFFHFNKFLLQTSQFLYLSLPQHNSYTYTSCSLLSVAPATTKGAGLYSCSNLLSLFLARHIIPHYLLVSTPPSHSLSRLCYF